MGKKEMYRKKSWIAVMLVGAVIVVALSLKFYTSKAGPWKQITIATATQGGMFYLLGDELAEILKRLPDQRIEDANALSTSGSNDNIQLLMDSKADVAFTIEPDLLSVDPNYPKKKELRILARLYRDVMQIVIRKDIGIANITDLKNKRVFIGPEHSGTREIAKQILKTVELSEESYTTDDALSFAEAAKRLKEDKLDAAFFMAGTPTVAVETALKSTKCELLSLEPNTLASLTERYRKLGLKKWDIPAHLYKNQSQDVNNVAADVFLVCRRDLDEDLAFVIVEALFDNITELLLVHVKAQEIRLTEAFENLPLLLHPGAVKFQKQEEEKLLIATGALDGRYYQLGKKIQEILEPLGIPARAIHTDGSVENAELLKERSTIAIMQYDAAIASRIGKPKFVYGMEFPIGIPQVRNIQRIAALHKEHIHMVARRDLEDKLGKEITSLDKLHDVLLNSEEKISVCLGPKRSATWLVARAILEHHGIESNSIEESSLSISEMVNRLQNEELDIGFFVSYVPTEAMKAILHDSDFKLLSLGKEQVKMAGRVFTTSLIDPNTYGCQEGDEVIRTLATQAVLVTTEDLKFNVETITEAIHKWGDLLGVAGSTMAKELPSIPLHTDAQQYYEKAGLLPSEPPLLHRLQWMWYILGCLTMLITVMLIPGYTGLIVLRRSRTGNEIGRRILAIQLEANARDSVQRLLKIREEIQERVRRRWWQWGELDKHRWRYLRDLIHDRIGEAKENLTRAFVAEIRDMTHNQELEKATRKQRYRSIEGRILEYFEKAELDPSQQKMLRELLRETIQQDVKAKESKGGKK
jgi:TRAP transporter TAXI family solute receptor